MKKLTALLIAMMAFSFNAYADEEAVGFTFYPHWVKTQFDTETRLEDDSHWGLGVGYRFDNPWALELVFQNADPDAKGNFAGDTDVDSWRLDALYHFETQSRVTPFVSFGVGGADIDSPTTDDNESMLNVGGGIKWHFSDRTSLRTDLKLFSGDEINTAVSAGLHFALGGERSKPAPAPVAPVEGDADGDGVLDSMDRCPNTPAGVEVDNRGCPLDDDGDGVYNYMDECPGTTDRRARIDSRGCYMKLERAVNFTLNIEFDFDSAKARPEHTAEVRKVADFMAQYPGSNVTMEGHTDSRGSDKYNEGLSERRAKTIAEMLVNDFGIASSRVSSVGYGESRPIDTNDTDEGRQRNRRVVASVSGAKKEEIEMK